MTKKKAKKKDDAPWWLAFWDKTRRREISIYAALTLVAVCALVLILQGVFGLALHKGGLSVRQKAWMARHKPCVIKQMQKNVPRSQAIQICELQRNAPFPRR